MGSILPLIPPIDIPGNWFFEQADDLAAKDEKRTLSQVLRGGGFTGQALKDAMALSHAESGADPDRENTTAPCSKDGDFAIGLMQICTVHKGTMGIPSGMAEAKKWLKNPDNNAKVAYKIWLRAGGTFAKDWEAWQRGAHRAHYGKDPVITTKKDTASGSVAGVAGDIADAALGPIDEIAGALLSPSTWFRAGKGVLGFALIVIGTGALVFVVANRTGAASTVKQAASKSAAGKAVNAVT